MALAIPSASWVDGRVSARMKSAWVVASSLICVVWKCCAFSAVGASFGL